MYCIYINVFYTKVGPDKGIVKKQRGEYMHGRIMERCEEIWFIKVMVG